MHLTVERILHHQHTLRDLAVLLQAWAAEATVALIICVACAQPFVPRTTLHLPVAKFRLLHVSVRPATVGCGLLMPCFVAPAYVKPGGSVTCVY